MSDLSDLESESESPVLRLRDLMRMQVRAGQRNINWRETTLPSGAFDFHSGTGFNRQPWDRMITPSPDTEYEQRRAGTRYMWSNQVAPHIIGSPVRAPSSPTPATISPSDYTSPTPQPPPQIPIRTEEQDQIALSLPRHTARTFFTTGPGSLSTYGMRLQHIPAFPEDDIFGRPPRTPSPVGGRPVFRYEPLPEDNLHETQPPEPTDPRLSQSLEQEVSPWEGPQSGWGAPPGKDYDRELPPYWEL